MKHHLNKTQTEGGYKNKLGYARPSLCCCHLLNLSEKIYTSPEIGREKSANRVLMEGRQVSYIFFAILPCNLFPLFYSGK